MKGADSALGEQQILQARARGEVSAEASFEQLYSLHGRAVLAWIAIRVGAGQVDDLFQDVWMIFFRRWQRWQFLPEMQAPEAKPVLSFLFRTCQLVLMGHRRRQQARQQEDAEVVELGDGAGGAARLAAQVELGRCLSLAREICSAEELDVLLAKLAGVPAREIAKTMGISEPVVDHRFRDAVARLKSRVAPAGKEGRGEGRRGKNG